MRLPRWSPVFLVVGLSVFLSVVPTYVTPSAVADVIVPPAVPPQLNVLPSQIKGSLGNTRLGWLTAQMKFLYAFSVSPEVRAAMAAKAAGVATPSQLAQVTGMTSSYAQPATKFDKLGRTIGSVFTAVSGANLGVSIGTGVLEVSGFEDLTGVLCRANKSGSGELLDGWSSILGIDCDALHALDGTYIANTGVATGTFGHRICAEGSTTACMTITKVPIQVFKSGANWYAQRFYCVQREGASSTPLARALTTGLYASVNSLWQTWDNTVCGTTSFTALSATVRQTQFSSTISGEDAAAKVTTQPFYTQWCYTFYATNYACTGGAGQDTLASLSTDPDRRLKCVLLATSGATTTGWSGVYRESEGNMPSPNCLPLAGGLTLSTTTIYEEVNGSLTELWSEGTTPEYQAAQTLAPECAGGTCLLDLKLNGVSCFVSVAACSDWLSDPDRDSKYDCTYGTHAVALTECYVYGPTFKEDSARTGDYLGDPYNGSQVTAPQGYSTGTDSAVSNAPAVGPGNRQCFPTGWAVMNPVEWVMKPVQCAIQWAFVPSTQAVTATRTGWNTRINNTVLAQAGGIIASFVDVFNVSSAGCQGPPFHIEFGPGPLFGDGGMDETYYPFSACAEPMAGYALIFNTMSLWFMFGAAQLACLRYIAGIFGYVGFGGGKIVSPESTAESGSFARSDGSSVRFR